jgi:hypothetical protein
VELPQPRARRVSCLCLPPTIINCVLTATSVAILLYAVQRVSMAEARVSALEQRLTPENAALRENVPATRPVP